jgi:hypothetical protein
MKDQLLILYMFINIVQINDMCTDNSIVYTVTGLSAHPLDNVEQPVGGFA